MREVTTEELQSLVDTTSQNHHTLVALFSAAW